MSDIPVLVQVLVVILLLSAFATVAGLVGCVYRELLRIRRSHLEGRYRNEQRLIEQCSLDQVIRAGSFGAWREVDNREAYIKKRIAYDKIN